MGLFKVKGSNRNDTRAVFQPFSMSRRLSKIAEEDDSSDHSVDKHKKNYPKGTPNKNKTTPTRSRHRFQKLVEWDYGTDDKEPYEPPQDFLSIQKTREDLFYERGPKKSKVVKVNSNSLDGLLRSSNQQKGENSSLKLFQFAADTASLSRSCSSDSASVTSANRSLKRPSREDDSSNNSGSNKIQKTQNPSKVSKLSNTRANGRSVFQNREGATPPVNNKTRFEEKDESDFGSFPLMIDKDNSNDFAESGWNLTINDDEETQTSELTGSTAHDAFGSFNPFQGFQGGSHNRELSRFQVQKQREPNKHLSNRAKALVEKSQAVINENKALFGSPENFKSSSPFEEGESPFKENENAIVFQSSIFRSKNNTQGNSNDRKHASPMIKSPPKPESQVRSKTSLTPGRVLAVRDNKVDTHVQPTKEQHLAPRHQKDFRPSVSFRFDFDDDKAQGQNNKVHRMKPPRTHNHNVVTAKGHTRRNPQRNPFADNSRNLGALPQLSPNSMHLFMDKASSFDSVSKKESFASTIDSCESNSTATSVSTFGDASPRGIRGSFPNHMVPATSSLSTSTASTNLLNDADYYKPSQTNPPPTGVPPSTIIGSMLFQAGDQDTQSRRSRGASINTLSPKRDNVPHNIHATGEAAVSDVTGTSTASDWMIQGNKLLSRYYYNDVGSSSSSSNSRKHKLSRQLRTREANNSAEYQKMMVGIQKGRKHAPTKNRLNSFMSEFNDRNDPLDKMRRHQHQFQYPNRQVRSGFDNQDDDDANSLFEA